MFCGTPPPPSKTLAQLAATSGDLGNASLMTTGNMAAAHFVGDGSQLTGIAASNQALNTTDSPTFGGLTLNGDANFNNNALNGVGTANVSYVNVGSGGNLSFGSGGSFASDLNGGTNVGSITGTLTGNASSATVAGGLSAGATTQDVTVNGPAAFRAGVTISGTTYLGSSGYVDSGGDAGFHSLDINFTGKGFASNGDVTAGAVNATGQATAGGFNTGFNQFNVNDSRMLLGIPIESSYGVPLQLLGSNVLVGTSTDNGTDKLQVAGSIAATSVTLTGLLNLGSFASGSRPSAASNAGAMLYNTTTNTHQGSNGTTWEDMY